MLHKPAGRTYEIRTCSYRDDDSSSDGSDAFLALSTEFMYPRVLVMIYSTTRGTEESTAAHYLFLVHRSTYHMYKRAKKTCAPSSCHITSIIYSTNLLENCKARSNLDRIRAGELTSGSFYVRSRPPATSECRSTWAKV